MRHRREDRRAELVRGRDDARRLHLRLELAELDRGPELLGERFEDALVFCANRPAREDEDVLLVEVDRRRGCLGSGGNAAAARRLDPPAVLRPVQDRRSLRVQDAPQAVEHRVDGSRPGEPVERLGLGLRPPTLDGSSRGEVDEHADRRRDREEHDEREDVLAPLDVERVERGSEVPVDEEDADDGRDERWPESADRRRPDYEQQEQKEHARQPDLPAQLSEDVGQ